MTKTFREVLDTKTVDFSTLAAGDYFYYDYTYYMKLSKTYESTEEDDYESNYYCYNSVDIKCGVLTYFEPETKVKPYKECEVILHE